MKDIQRAFAVFDKEGKGHIRTDELKHMMTKIGTADVNVAEMVGVACCRHVCSDPPASTLCHNHPGEALTEDEVDEMIRKLDSDRSGTIDVHEFASMM